MLLYHGSDHIIEKPELVQERSIMIMEGDSIVHKI